MKSKALKIILIFIFVTGAATANSFVLFEESNLKINDKKVCKEVGKDEISGIFNHPAILEILQLKHSVKFPWKVEFLSQSYD
jgi:hypothetical protein